MAIEFEPCAEPFILGETGEYIAVFKPAGMHSIPSCGKSEGIDLLSWFARKLPGAEAAFAGVEAQSGHSELGMVSRLDEGTSGIIIFARTPVLQRSLFSLASEGGVIKEYRLLAAASKSPLPGSIPGIQPLDLRLKSAQPTGGADWVNVESFFRSYGKGARKVACVAPDRASECRRKLTKKTYVTHVRPESRASGFAPGTLVVSARISVGFRHQIRAHLVWSGYPILGDRVYGGNMASRLYLEAHRIEIGGVNPAIFELYGGLRAD
ncbi:MAG: RNA pseudouridine synthase [Spirochaetes bacterium]|nr:RNA pseudouridine synthase [Spirochaetota bacterium]